MCRSAPWSPGRRCVLRPTSRTVEPAHGPRPQARSQRCPWACGTSACRCRKPPRRNGGRLGHRRQPRWRLVRRRRPRRRAPPTNPAKTRFGTPRSLRARTPKDHRLDAGRLAPPPRPNRRIHRHGVAHRCTRPSNCSPPNTSGYRPHPTPASSSSASHKDATPQAST